VAISNEQREILRREIMAYMKGRFCCREHSIAGGVRSMLYPRILETNLPWKRVAENRHRPDSGMRIVFDISDSTWGTELTKLVDSGHLVRVKDYNTWFYSDAELFFDESFPSAEDLKRARSGLPFRYSTHEFERLKEHREMYPNQQEVKSGYQEMQRLMQRHRLPGEIKVKRHHDKQSVYLIMDGESVNEWVRWMRTRANA